MTRSRPVVLAAVGAALLAAVLYQMAGCGLLEPCQSEGAACGGYFQSCCDGLTCGSTSSGQQCMRLDGNQGVGP